MLKLKRNQEGNCFTCLLSLKDTIIELYQTQVTNKQQVKNYSQSTTAFSVDVIKFVLF